MYVALKLCKHRLIHRKVEQIVLNGLQQCYTDTGDLTTNSEKAHAGGFFMYW